MFETLGHYKILDWIGAGGMGEVYRARDTRLGRTVAIKVLPAELAGDEARRERLLREARAAASLSHPNIAALYEIGEDQGHLFLVFEFVPGKTLKTEIGGRPINPRRAIEFAIEIADALADAHAEGVIHRDIKPDNIIITPKEHAKILDFGLATWTAGGAEREQAATMIATGAGAVLGTVAYMSPEQALGEQVDQRTDIFSLGIVLFEMITGRLPFSGTTSTALALQIVQAQAPSPSSIVNGLQPEVDAIVVKALAKSIAQRYESAATFAAELRALAAILDVRSDANPLPPLQIEASSPPSHRWIAWMLAALVVVALGLAALAKWDIIRGEWRRRFGSAPPPVIAVIPLELAGPDAAQMFFADGLTEDLITRLGQTPGLKVFGRSATRGYRSRPPRDVARELGAAVVLTGSVRPSGDTVKVSLELVNPADGRAIWSNQYTRELKDIFQVQAQMADEIAAALRVKLQPTPARARTAARLVDPRAYETYLRARQATVERRLGDAIDLYEKAIGIDSGLAEAHGGLAEALHRQWSFDGSAPAAPVFGRIRAELNEAFAIDPDLPQAHVAAAIAAQTFGDAVQHLRTAIKTDPSDAAAYHVVGDVIKQENPERAVAFYQASLDLDPHYDANHSDLVMTFLLLDRREDADRQAAMLPNDTTSARTARLMLAERDVMDGRATSIGGEKPAAGGFLMPWIRYVRALLQTAQYDAAQSLLDAILRLSPQNCDARALVAGRLLLMRSAKAPDAVAEVSSMLQRDDEIGALTPCGVLFAAVRGDAALTAAYIGRMTSPLNPRNVQDSHLAADIEWFDQRRGWYPWNQVADDPRVIGAVRRLDEERLKVRIGFAALLPQLPSR